MAQPKNDDQITFRLPAAEKKDLKAAAERRQRSHNWLAQHIFEGWLARQPPIRKK